MRRWFAKGHRRWLRLVLPFLVVLAVIVTTGVVHVMQEPDLGDPAYLNPDSDAPIGASQLRATLAAEGIQVERYTSSTDVLARAARGDVTVFVPEPGLMYPDYLVRLGDLPGGTRVVLVDPTGVTLSNADIPVTTTGSRWTTKAVAPDCETLSLTGVGVAAVYHTRYGGAATRCYHDAVAQFPLGATSMVAVGADDPFRNDRIGEYSNAKLANLLLSAHGTVAWLDLHQAEQPPPADANQPTGTPVPAPTNGSSDRDFPGRQAGGGGPAGGGGQGNSSPSSASQARDSGLSAPAWLSSGIVLALLALLALGLATGRRLGPPVSEPLPVVVRASETVRGRGRLYQRARARGPALHALRTAALGRLLPALDLEPDAVPSTVVGAVSTRTGLPPDYVGELLYGAEPVDDEALVRAATGLQDLLHRTLSVHKGESP